MAIKNQSIVIYVRAWDTANNAWKTGDAANITMYTVLDGGTPGAIAGTVAEVDATNMPGVYKFNASASELNGNSAMFSGKSSTANIAIVGQSVITEQGTIAAVDTVVDAVKAVTDKVDTMIEVV